MFLSLDKIFHCYLVKTCSYMLPTALFVKNLLFFLVEQAVSPTLYQYQTLLAVVPPGGSSGKEFTCQRRRCRKCGSWIRKIPCRRAWQPTAVFLPEESHEPRILAGFSPQGHKELGMTEATQHLYALLPVIHSCDSFPGLWQLPYVYMHISTQWTI